MHWHVPPVVNFLRDDHTLGFGGPIAAVGRGGQIDPAEESVEGIARVLNPAGDDKARLFGHDRLYPRGIGVFRRHLALGHNQILAFHRISQRMHTRPGLVGGDAGPEFNTASQSAIWGHNTSFPPI